MTYKKKLEAMELRKERLYGLDIARILAMLLVVLFHVAGVFSGYSDSCFAGRILRSFSICCVDLFALISGYVGICSRLRPSRIVMLWLQIVFTGLIIVGMSFLFGSRIPTIKDLGKAVMPISGYEYWYMTAYFFLFLLMPFLNAGFSQLTKRATTILIAAIFILVVVLPSFNPYASDTYKFVNGFSTAWLVVCYVVGGLIRELDGGYGRAPFWLLITALLVGLNIIWSGNYSHLAVLALAGSTLVMCSRLKIEGARTKKLISFMSSTSLGVYLWHAHPIVYAHCVDRVHFVCMWPWMKAISFIAVLTIIIYVACSMLDYCRIRIWRLLQLEKMVRKIDNFLGI